MLQRRQIWENLSLESKDFVNKYLQENLKMGHDWIKHEKFLFPDYEKTILNGAAMHDMDRAVERVFLAIKKKERICVFGDYDCDGVPGTALLRDFFEKINYSNVEYYIPHRHTEGYGLNMEAIKSLVSKDKEPVELLITIDLGTTNIKEIELANELGMDVIVTDHHLPMEGDDGQILPKAFAILNNKKNSCEYANKDLCGSGTVFKLVCELLKELENIFDNKSDKFKKSDFEKVDIKLPQKGYEKWLLDLVAIATIADLVPLTDENRTLAIYGLHVLSKTNRAGLRTVFANAKTSLQNVNETDIAFTVAPRINSASRMAHPKIALSMFSQNLKEGINAAHELEDLNKNRKDLTNNIIKKIYKILDKRMAENKLPNVLVIGDADWNAGILGILAQKIVDKYKVNVFCFGGNEIDEDNNLKKFKGSARGRGDVHVVKLMSLCKEFFLHFGGHAEAGGFEIEFARVHELEKKLNENFEEARILLDNLNEDFTKIKKNIFKITLENVNADFLKALSLLGPFGMGNPKPFFQIENFDEFTTSKFGKNKEHLKIVFSKNVLQNNIEKKILREAIKFYVDEELEHKILEDLNNRELFFEIEAGYNSNIPRLKII